MLEAFGLCVLSGRTYHGCFSLGTLTEDFDPKVSYTRKWGVNPARELEAGACLSPPTTVNWCKLYCFRFNINYQMFLGERVSNESSECPQNVKTDENQTEILRSEYHVDSQRKMPNVTCKGGGYWFVISVTLIKDQWHYYNNTLITPVNKLSDQWVLVTKNNIVLFCIALFRLLRTKNVALRSKIVGKGIRKDYTKMK